MVNGDEKNKLKYRRKTLYFNVLHWIAKVESFPGKT